MSYVNADYAALLKVISDQQITIDKLTQRIEQLLHLLYGIKTEKRKPPSSEEEQPKSNKSNRGTNTDNASKENESLGKGRRTLPVDLPRVQIEHDLAKEQQCCECGCQMQRMGKMVTEQLDFKPAELFVKEHIRFKYSCRGCQKIKVAALPPQPIDKGLPGPGLLAEIIINKYQDSLPLYRQEHRFKRHGIELTRSTLCDWVMQSGFLLEPIVQLMRTDALLPGKRIFTDDTPVPVLAKGKTHKGRMWVYIGGKQDEPNCVIYNYTPTRSQTGPVTFLQGYKGYLQADAYSGYDILYKTKEIIEVACMAHARRKFFEITLVAKEPGLADTALEFIGKLYEIERRGRSLSVYERKFFRKKYSKLILHCYWRWLKETRKRVLPKTPIAAALDYSLNHWVALTNYLRDGILKIDNNTSERAMKSVVIGRKNWLFSGSHEGAKRAAVLYSLIETCKLNGINPFYYLKEVLSKLPTTLMKDLHQLLPYNWKAERAN